MMYSCHDGKMFLNEKAKKVHDFYVSRRADLELLGEEYDENELFYLAVGGHDCTRRIYGLDSYGRSIYAGNSSETITSPLKDMFSRPRSKSYNKLSRNNGPN